MLHEERMSSALRFKLGAVTVMPKAGRSSSSSSTQGLGSQRKSSCMNWPDSSLIGTCMYRWEVRKQQLVFTTYFDSLGEHIFNFQSSRCFHQTQEETGGSSVAGSLSPNLAQGGAPPGMGNLWLVIGWVLCPLNVHLGEVNQMYSGENECKYLIAA